MTKLFEELNGPNSMNGQFQNFAKNPFGFLFEREINIPQQFQNDPHQAVNYLVSSGKMDQGTLNSLMQKAQMMGFKFN